MGMLRLALCYRPNAMYPLPLAGGAACPVAMLCLALGYHSGAIQEALEKAEVSTCDWHNVEPLEKAAAELRVAAALAQGWLETFRRAGHGAGLLALAGLLDQDRLLLPRALAGPAATRAS